MLLLLIEMTPGPLEMQSMLPWSVVPRGRIIGESRRVAFMATAGVQLFALMSLVVIGSYGKATVVGVETGSVVVVGSVVFVVSRFSRVVSMVSRPGPSPTSLHSPGCRARGCRPME